MDLTPEDALRINVLLASQIEAIRLDESRMTLFALSQKGEAKVKLNPNCRDDAYLRKVRETLSSHVLGSPGGYPVYLKRWTRMGQARDEVLESLLPGERVRISWTEVKVIEGEQMFSEIQVDDVERLSPPSP